MQVAPSDGDDVGNRNPPAPPPLVSPLPAQRLLHSHGGGVAIAATFHQIRAAFAQCTECGRGDRKEEELLLCYHCDHAYHAQCLCPEAAPPARAAGAAGEWFCPPCCEQSVAAVAAATTTVVATGGATAMAAAAITGSLPVQAQVALVLNRVVLELEAQLWRSGLVAGSELDALDRTGNWFKSRITTASSSAGGTRQLKVHYTGWAARYDEWLPADSDCLMPSGSQRLARAPDPTPRAKKAAKVVNPPRTSQGGMLRPEPPVAAAEDVDGEGLAVVGRRGDAGSAAAVGAAGRRDGRCGNPLQPFCLFENVATMPKGELGASPGTANHAMYVYQCFFGMSFANFEFR